jgi:hypothetical protein
MDTEDRKQNEGRTRHSDRKPDRQLKVALSKDGRYWIFRDTTTWFIPANYLTAISNNSGGPKVPSGASVAFAAVENLGGEDDRAN